MTQVKKGAEMRHWQAPLVKLESADAIISTVWLSDGSEELIDAGG